MKKSLIVAFVVFVVSLITSVIFGLQLIWHDERRLPSPESWRLLGTSIVIMLAALFYVPVGEALNRILSADRKSSSDDKR